MKKIISLLILISLCSSMVLPAEGPVDAARLKTAIDKLARKYHVPDFSIGIVNKDSVLFHYDKNPENAGKNYLIGSCSKSFTALAVMKLSQDKRINLDQPVKSYLPWFAMKNPAYTERVTVRDLLNQKSGFERQDGFFDLKTDNVDLYENALALHIKKIKTRRAPGTQFEYSNLNYVLLGLIIYHATGQLYGDYMSMEMLPRLGMKNTFATGRENFANNPVKAYQYSIGCIPFQSRYYYYSNFMIPAGYISSNTRDIGNYLRFVLNQTVDAKGDTMLLPKNYAAWTGLGHTGYAMGWFRFEMNSVEVINHSGLDENYASSLSFFPQLGLGSVILCNINSLEFCSAMDREIRSIILEKPMPASSFSFEKLMRWATFLFPLLLFAGLIWNIKRWSRNGYQLDLVQGLLPHLRLLTGIMLSIVFLIFASINFQMPVGKMIRFQPDIGWGLLTIAILGILSSFARYFGSLKAD
jgi:CubicO group peptidase (beta-lactamase class C family)